MDIFEALETRRSVRKFKSDPIPEEDIRKIVEYATKAPSAGNNQMWRFIAVSNRKTLDGMKNKILHKLDSLISDSASEASQSRLQSARNYSTFFTDAPVTIVVLGEPYTSMIDKALEGSGLDRAAADLLRHRPDMQSIGAAIENLCLSAHAMGYGTCWMTGPCIAGPEIGKLLGVESPWKVAALVPLGVPVEKSSVRPRKPVEEVLEFVR